MKRNGIFKKCFYAVIAGYFLLFSTGCASLGTYNTATEKKEFIFISTAEEMAMGDDIHRKLEKEFKFSNDAESNERVNRIGQRLARVSDRQDYGHQFYVVEKDELNAFTVPGGRIYIFSGLLEKLETDDQVASVLAHEIGHCAAKHTVKKFQAAMGYDFLGRLILSQLGGQTRQIVNLSSGVLMNIVFSAYSRKDEYESDRLGLKYMYLSNYDLNGMPQTFEILKKASQGSGMPVILKSHPHLDDRIVTVKKEIYTLQSKYQ